jgi:GNAT superfamily N-acetyltransferase
MNWLNVDLTFQNVEKEFSEFTTMYGPPDGAYLLAFEDDELAGGVGLRKLQAKVCEMKRLYVYDRFRRKRIGRALCEELIRHAKEIGYASMRLDTIDRLADAIRLYENLGFIDIENYRYNPDPTARFMELKL